VPINGLTDHGDAGGVSSRIGSAKWWRLVADPILKPDGKRIDIVDYRAATIEQQPGAHF
jgi:hypothetical protein